MAFNTIYLCIHSCFLCFIFFFDDFIINLKIHTLLLGIMTLTSQYPAQVFKQPLMTCLALVCYKIGALKAVNFFLLAFVSMFYINLKINADSPDLDRLHVCTVLSV